MLLKTKFSYTDCCFAQVETRNRTKPREDFCRILDMEVK